MISVLLSSPLATSARTTSSTPSSTESNEPSWQRYMRRSPSIQAGPNRGRLRISVGLSETSGSLKFGGWGSGSGSNA